MPDNSLFRKWTDLVRSELPESRAVFCPWSFLKRNEDRVFKRSRNFFATLFSQFLSCDSWLSVSHGRFPSCQIIWRCWAVQLELSVCRRTAENIEIRWTASGSEEKLARLHRKMQFEWIMMESVQGCGSIGMPRWRGPSELCLYRAFDWNQGNFAREGNVLHGVNIICESRYKLSL
jgi:hypothetical protein